MNFIKAADLTEDQKEQIWNIYRDNYEMEKESFFATIPTSSTLITANGKKNGRIVGFVIVDTRSFQLNNETVRIIFTSRLIIQAKHRGQNFAAISGLIFFLRELVSHPFSKHYWFFAAVSLPGYAILVRNFKVFWPRPLETTPKSMKEFIDVAADHYFKTMYDKNSGTAFLDMTLKYDPFRVRSFRELPPFKEFYREQVPQAESGQCLICLAPLSFTNFMNWLSRTILWKVRKLKRRLKTAEFTN